MIGGMPLKKTNEMPKNQTGNHATVPKLMGKGPKYPFAFYVALVLSMTVGAVPVLAAGDPLAVINNLSTFIFSLIRAIGLILLGFGVVQVGLSLKSHDPSQRANGFLTLAGGVIHFRKRNPGPDRWVAGRNGKGRGETLPAPAKEVKLFE